MPSDILRCFFFKNLDDMNHFFDHQVKFKRGNDPCSGELSYNFFFFN